MMLDKIALRLNITRLSKLILLVVTAGVLSACGGANNGDLTQYIAETKRRPAGAIDPLPSFTPYQSFTYSAATKRSPFQPPVRAIEEFVGGGSADIQPDLNRVREFLENFSIASLTMVGTLEREGSLWALIDDGRGGIHRVRKGNYLGRDHGKIVTASQNQLTVLELVSDGLDGWIERPRTIELSVQE
ncbi:pilus assembly protein PilP [Sessilibacter corallicola]|uniref:pilus assembly protein PilP n=1 Tax=Sessilibacter corallicola TaxID=2904075 RepID=UPI001E5F38F0|nr:pilus assembly protein PilP [Sessilibacter corallicola]MCE2027647.1 pilus assembly protein PilP [Sessilibacter corallicola]